MNDQELNNLINIRDFANRNFDNINFRLSNDEVRALRAKIVLMDKVILSSLLTFDPTKTLNKVEDKQMTPSDTKQPSSAKAEKMKVRRVENTET